MRTLSIEQLKIKKERDKRRKKFREKLRKRGHKSPVIPKGFKKSGSSKGFSSNENSSVGMTGNSSGGSSGNAGYYTDTGSVSLASYLNAGLNGFDTYVNFNEPKIYYDEDTSNSITFDEIKYISIRLASGTVDGSNYASKWSSGTIVQEYGTSGAGANNEDYTENPFDYSKDSLADGTYTLIIKYDLGSSTDTTWYSNGWYRWSIEVELDTLTAPNGSYSQSNNEFTFSSYLSGSARVLEFNRSSYTPYSSYRSNEVHNILYNCALRNHEFGIYDGQANPLSDFQILTMWDTGSYEVKVSFDASHPSGTQSDYSDAVNDWITLINSTISGSGVSFSRNDSATSPDILVETKSNSAMGSTANYIYAGTWETSVDGDGFIYYALVKLNYETDKFDFFHTIDSIVKEEATQSLGIGGDLTTRADIINSDFNYLQKKQYWNDIYNN
jgi:hypothetical protein